MSASSREDKSEDKDVAFYSATVSAWYTTRFEKDKHLLGLSVAAIGVLVTLATAIGATTFCTAIMYIFAVISFLICIVCVLAIFGQNAKYLESLVHDNSTEKDPTLSILDNMAMVSFIFGIVFALLVGLFSSIDKFNTEGKKMNEKIEKVISSEQEMEKKSVNGASNMRPSKPPEKPTGGQGSQSDSSSNADKK